MVPALVALLGCLGLAEGSCSVGNYDSAASATDPNCYVPQCANAIRAHVKMEFDAALQYLVMGAYFGQDSVNLEGFSQMFYTHAEEERTHGLKFIEYLRMRGNW